MLLSYLKLSLRLLARNPFFTFINVLGLSVGFAAFFILWNSASSELHTDQYHPNFSRIGRLGIDWRWTDDGKIWGYKMVSWFDLKTSKQISIDFPEVEDYVRILQQPDFGGFDRDTSLLDHGTHIVLSRENMSGNAIIFKETKAVYADPNLFQFFSIPLLEGTKEDVLKYPNSIALSEKMARKYFGDKSPIGELMSLNNEITLKVTGVFENLPPNTHLNFDFVLSNASVVDRWNIFTWPNAQCYVRLKDIGFSLFEKKINVRKSWYWSELLRSRPNVRASMWVQPLSEIAFSNNYTGDYFFPKSKSLQVMLAIASLVVLAMALINYLNITLARTSKRLKEISARKTSGAMSRDFALQFLIESTLINLFAISIALTWLQLLKRPAKQLLNLPTLDSHSITPQSLILFSCVVISGIMITGFYPAIVARKNSLWKIDLPKAGSSSLTSFLTSFQYTCTMALSGWVVAVFFQLSFILNKGLTTTGNTTNAVIESPLLRSGSFTKELETFTQELISKGLVYDAASSNSLVGDDIQIGFDVKKNKNGEVFSVASNGGVSENFIPFFAIHLLAGRNFVTDDRGDVVIVSSRAIQRLGFLNASDALGARIHVLVDGAPEEDLKEVEIIGVIEDYNTRPLFNFVEIDSESKGNGILLTYMNGAFEGFTPERLAVKVNVANLKKVIHNIEGLYAKHFPGNPFVFYFQDEHINRHYNNEKLSRNQIIFFTFLAIGISCLGILGMITNKVVEKTKEIGIRKVMGAQLLQIAQLLLRTTIKQVVISLSIGIPVAYNLIQYYLEKFSERIVLQWWHFVLPVLIFILILLATIASVLWKAAKSNPVEALKYE